jgi:hypothetical protein
VTTYVISLLMSLLSEVYSDQLFKILEILDFYKSRKNIGETERDAWLKSWSQLWFDTGGYGLCSILPLVQADRDNTQRAQIL